MITFGRRYFPDVASLANKRSPYHNHVCCFTKWNEKKILATARSRIQNEKNTLHQREQLLRREKRRLQRRKHASMVTQVTVLTSQTWPNYKTGLNLRAAATPDAASTPFGCCNPTKCARPPAVFRQRWDAAGPEGFLLCPGSSPSRSRSCRTPQLPEWLSFLWKKAENKHSILNLDHKTEINEE